jgi:hypothetical protein
MVPQRAKHAYADIHSDHRSNRRFARPWNNSRQTLCDGAVYYHSIADLGNLLSEGNRPLSDRYSNRRSGMSGIAITLARFASAAWVGAAVLFVTIAVWEVRYPEFDSATKDTLALLRFPAYYVFGFVLVGTALLGAVLAFASTRPLNASREDSGRSAENRGGKKRLGATAGLLAISLALMVADFFAVYRPMVEMITPPGRARPAEFRTYHRASVWLNTADVALCAVAAVLLCWPARYDRRETTEIRSEH